tara:strand:+ start:1370 stop:1660 length:291 start_codon:yes stop_codon:yes gene_type:complete
MSKTVTREYLAECIKKEMGLPRSECIKLVHSVFYNISKGLRKDGLVKIPSLGTFKVRKKNKRMGRNPKTGVEAIISERSVVTYNASEKLKLRLNGR